MSTGRLSLASLVGSDGVFVDGDWVESKDQDPDGDVRLLQLADVGDGIFVDKSARFLTSAKARALKCTFLERGDILVARMPDPLGRACVFPGAPQPCVTVVDVCIVRPGTHVDRRWLLHAINSPAFRVQIGQHIKGTTRQRISRSNLGTIELDVPPLLEQRRIADILDKADAIRRKRKEAIALTEELLRSAFLEMFGDPAANPKGWDVKPLGDCASRVTKGESPGWQGFRYQESGVRFVTSENVLFGRVDLEKAKYIPEGFDEKLARSRLGENDVLVNLVGASIGRAAIVPKEALPANINQAVAVISLVEQKLLPQFILHQLLSPSMQRRLLGNIVDAARANISLTDVRGLQITVPPLAEQVCWRRFVHRLALARGHVVDSLRYSEQLFDSLVHDVFRVEFTSGGLARKQQPGLFDAGSR